tara:strand:+ start:5503 stop:9267 length:3765 start_codon:yes stop_codon:yes gene_type:complete
MSINIDKNLLIKLYDFNPYDESVYNTDNNNNNNNFKCNKEYMVQLFGISERGYTASIYVKNYKPCFYVKVPDNWDEQLKNEFISHMRKKMGLYYEESILNSYFIKKNKLYGFDNFKLHNFIYIEFSCVQAFNKAKKIFYKETKIGNFYEKKLLEDGYKFLDYNVFLYEAHIPPLLKLFHIKEISPSGWILCCAKKIKHIYNKKTYAHYEFEIDYKDIISKPEKETAVKYNICSFDIEASSSHGDFPVAIKDYKKLAIDIITYYNSLEDKTLFNNDLLKKCVISAFINNSINEYTINTVYPKEEVNIDNIEKALENITKTTVKSKKNIVDDYFISDTESESESESENELLDNNFKPKSKKNKKYTKDVTILEVILDNKCDVNVKIKYLNKFLSDDLPELEGDIVTFIGLSFLYYGDKKSYRRILLVKDGCKPPPDYDLEKNVTKIIVCNTEKDLLLKFSKIIQLKQPHMVIGYNINGFDFDFMFDRSKELECSEEFLKLSYNKNEICYNQDWKTGKFDIEKSKIFLASGEYNLKYIKMPGRVIIDLYNVFRREHVLSSYKLDYTSSYFISDSVKKYEILDNNTTKIYSSNLTGLNELAYVKFEEISYSVNYYKQGAKFKIININDEEKSFIIDSKEEFDLNNKKVNWGLAKDDISPAEIFKLSMGSDEDRWLVGKYCLADCDNVLELLLKNDIITSCVEMSNLCSVPLNYLLVRGQGIKLTSYVSKKCSEKNILIPVIEKSTDNGGYEGAHVLSPKTGLYLEDPVSCLDYSSLYPSSIISENISHDSKVWTKEYDLSDNLLKETGEKDENNDYIYDNLSNYKYVDIKYDTYKYIRTTAKAAAKKVIVGYKICRFAQFPDNKLAVLPSILQELLNARKATRKMIKTQNNEFMKNVLDKRQLTIKLTANSVYGQSGAKTSTFYEKDVAASTTAVGRMLLSYAKNIVEECYHNYEKKMSDDNDVIINAECVYGDTDSVFVKFDFTNKTDNTKIKNKIALEYSIEIAQEAGELATKFLKSPHDLEYEKTFWPFCLLSKKRYDGMLYEFDPNKCKLKSMGNVLKRRDNAPIVKDIYGGVINILMKDKNLNKAIKFVDDSLQDIKNEKFDIDKLVVTKSLRSYYKNPNQIAHNVLANRIGNRDTKPGPGDRINYVYIVNPNKKALQGEKIETPQFILENDLKIDYNFYISNQIMKPLLQLFSLELENMVEFKKKRGHTLNSWYNEINKLKEKWEDPIKFNNKYEELRCKEVKSLIFDKYLN